jgi:hypothetical protein
MALAIATTTAVPTRFVLACDDALRAANGADVVAEYERTRDWSTLSIPEDATWVAARPLDRRALVLHDLRSQAFVGDDIARGLSRLEAIAADVIESISDFADLHRTVDGYPVRELYARMHGSLVVALISEVVGHVVAVSTLGKPQASPSVPSRGEASRSGRAIAATSTGAQRAPNAQASRTTRKP